MKGFQTEALYFLLDLFGSLKIRLYFCNQMTRINSNISVQSLTDEHLLAEHREIKRLPYCLKEAIRSGSINHIPDKFTLGKGHVLFFVNKQKFLKNRYIELYNECIKRGFNVTNYLDNWNGILIEHCNDYQATDVDIQLIRDRISFRIINSNKKCWHYNNKQITKEQAIQLL